MIADAMGLPIDSSGEVVDVHHLTRGMVAMRDEAWESFHDRYFTRLYAYALRLHRGDHASAQDSVQTCFLRAVRNIRRFKTEEAFWGWLTLLLRCAAADQGRRVAASARLHERLAHEVATAQEFRFPEAGEATLLVLMGEALQELLASDRALVEGKYIERQDDGRACRGPPGVPPRRSNVGCAASART